MIKSKRPWNDIFYRPEKAAYLFIIPSILIMSVFCVIPLVTSFGISFTNMNLFFSKRSFVGFANYAKALSTPRLLNSFWNSLYYMIIQVPSQLLVGLIIAVLLQKQRFVNRFAKAALFIPVVCSMTCISLVWSMILDPTIGLIPYFLSTLGLPKITFLKDVNLAMPTLAFIAVWKGMGFTMTIVGAGLTGISSNYYEAARIDGASAAQQFTKITIPLLTPTLGFCVVNGMIGALQMFDQAYAATGGGPMLRTETAVMYIYSRAFTSPYEIGYACSISVLLFILIMFISLGIRYFVNRQERAIFD